MRLGLIINPLAGIGGAVGLKGSDGDNIVKIAFERGAVEKANFRAKKVFELIKKDLSDKLKNIEIFSAPGCMGSDMLVELDFKHNIIGSIGSKTSASDTTRIAKEIIDLGVDLLIFAGGDGTARNIYDATGSVQPCIGIPAGTKMHSSVFAYTPESAAIIVERFLLNKGYEMVLREVMDLNEEAYRNEKIDTRLYGYLNVPYVINLMQASKNPFSRGENNDIESICQYVVDNMEDNVLYLKGTGSTVLPIMNLLNLDGSMLGVDAIYNKQQLGKDIYEKNILELLEKYKKAKIIITVIGGQGYLFGRGNQQFSPEILKRIGRDNIIIIATKTKLNSISGSLRVDTGDSDLDKELRGYYRIITDYDYYTVKKVE